MEVPYLTRAQDKATEQAYALPPPQVLFAVLGA